MLRFFLKRKRVLFLSVLFLIASALFVQDVKIRGDYSCFDKMVVRIFAPPLEFSTFCLKKARHLWYGYIYLINLRSDLSSLEQVIKNLQLENQLLREKAIENSRLRELLGFKKRLACRFIPAEIIGRDPSSLFRTLLIDKGRADGLARGAAVITAQGVVGQILGADAHTAQVLLIIDGDSAIDVLVQRSRARAILEGGAEELCELRYVSKTEDIQKGDVVVTSGLNGIFPKGLRVGEVITVQKNTPDFFPLVEVKPAVDFTKLEEVLIVLQ